jgi:hypothetical protein
MPDKKENDHKHYWQMSYRDREGYGEVFVFAHCAHCFLEMDYEQIERIINKPTQKTAEKIVRTLESKRPGRQLRVSVTGLLLDGASIEMSVPIPLSEEERKFFHQIVDANATSLVDANATSRTVFSMKEEAQVADNEPEKP